MIDSTTGTIIVALVAGGVVYYALKQKKDDRQSLSRPRKINYHQQLPQMMNDPFNPMMTNIQKKAKQKMNGALVKTAHFI